MRQLTAMMRQLTAVLASIPLAMLAPVALAPMILAATAQTQDWQPLDEAALKDALTARLMAYEDGATQQFNADGTTVYTKDKPSNGQWRIEANQYCSQWPPSDRWTCYDVARSADGLNIRFTAPDASTTTGRYTDLQ
jgi:hypothetical protein